MVADQTTDAKIHTYHFDCPRGSLLTVLILAGDDFADLGGAKIIRIGFMFLENFWIQRGRDVERILILFDFNRRI